MTKKNSTRHALMLSVLSMLLCILMLAGTTFAWFTDAVTTGANRIVAGNLDVELEYKNAKTGEWTNVTNAPDDLPDFFVDVNGKQILWEPGVMSVTQFKVMNVGNLALKYELTSLVKECNYLKDKDGDLHDLSEVIKFAVIPGEADPTREEIETMTTADFDSFAKNAWLMPKNEEFVDDSVTPSVTVKDNEIFTVVAYWMPNDNKIDNLYNVNNGQHTVDASGNPDGIDELEIKIEINLFATQKDFEEDSFNNQYDVMAPYKVINFSATPDDIVSQNIVVKLTEKDPVIVVKAMIDPGASTVTTINNQTVPIIYLELEDEVETVIFANSVFDGNVHFGTNRITAAAQPTSAGLLKTLRFENCTFNGIWYQNLANLAMSIEFVNCTFNNTTYADRYSMFVQYDTKWDAKTEARDLSYVGCTFNCIRGVQITQPDMVNVKFINNKFNVNNDNANEACAIALNSTGSGTKQQFSNVEIYDNTLNAGDQLVGFYTGSLKMVDGAKVYLDGNTICTGAFEIGTCLWKTAAFDDSCVVNGRK